jgi:glycosyltransferase involved in cell wall biosynthesis
MKFSLIIPCYNESKSLPQLLERCAPLIQKGNIEVILVDNGSNDETATVLNRLLPQYPGCRSIRVEQNQGYGFGITCGLSAASGDILGWTHADLQTDPADILQGIALFEQFGTNTLVKGKRYGRPLSDALFTAGMSLFETILFRRAFWDINAQPNLFPRNFFEGWVSIAPKDFSLDLFVYFMAQKKGLAIKRFPVKFGKRVFGTSHWNIDWKAKKKFIMRTIQFSLELKKQV